MSFFLNAPHMLPCVKLLRNFAHIFFCVFLYTNELPRHQRRTFTIPDTRFHKIGDLAENDSKLYVAEEPTWHIGAEVTDDGR